MRVAPDQPIAWQNLGDTYLSQGNFADARKALETALKLQNSVGAAREPLSRWRLITGDRRWPTRRSAAIAGKREEVDFLGVRMHGATFLAG